MNKGKHKGKALELYYAPISRIPIRRIDFDDPSEVKTHNHLVKLVDNIIEAKRNLAAYNQLFSKARLTRLLDSDPLPEMTDEEILKSSQPSNLRIIRTHPQVRYKPKNPQHFYLKSIREAEDAESIVITSKDKQKIALTAPKALLAYLQRILPNYVGQEWTQIVNQVPIPIRPDLFDSRRDKILSEVGNLRHRIRAFQEQIDPLVFDLYDLSQPEQEIVTKAHS